MHYKKMAGTAAVFVLADKHANKPVECQGPIWNDRELKMDTLPRQLVEKPPMATNLALEGLETYDPPEHGDMRTVTALGARFVYVAPIRGWVELALPGNAISPGSCRHTSAAPAPAYRPRHN